MKLHTSLTYGQVMKALRDTQAAGQMTADVQFVQFTLQGSRSHQRGYLIQLGTYDQRSGPTNSRHYKNSGHHGATSEYGIGENIWAATYDEWGWFIARIFAADPKALFGTYAGRDDFNAKTHDMYVLGQVAIVDEEATPPRVVARVDSAEAAESWMDGITDRDKVLRGGYAIDAPDDWGDLAARQRLALHLRDAHHYRSLDAESPVSLKALAMIKARAGCAHVIGEAGDG